MSQHFSFSLRPDDEGQKNSPQGEDEPPRTPVASNPVEIPVSSASEQPASPSQLSAEEMRRARAARFAKTPPSTPTTPSAVPSSPSNIPSSPARSVLVATPSPSPLLSPGRSLEVKRPTPAKEEPPPKKRHDSTPRSQVEQEGHWQNELIEILCGSSLSFPGSFEFSLIDALIVNSLSSGVEPLSFLLKTYTRVSESRYQSARDSEASKFFQETKKTILNYISLALRYPDCFPNNLKSSQAKILVDFLIESSIDEKTVNDIIECCSVDFEETFSHVIVHLLRTIKSTSIVESSTLLKFYSLFESFVKNKTLLNFIVASSLWAPEGTGRTIEQFSILGSLLAPTTYPIDVNSMLSFRRFSFFVVFFFLPVAHLPQTGEGEINVQQCSRSVSIGNRKHHACAAWIAEQHSRNRPTNHDETVPAFRAKQGIAVSLDLRSRESQRHTNANASRFECHFVRSILEQFVVRAAENLRSVFARCKQIESNRRCVLHFESTHCVGKRCEARFEFRGAFALDRCSKSNENR